MMSLRHARVRLLLATSFVVLGVGRAALAQKPPEFEVASIKVHAGRHHRWVRPPSGLRITGSQVRISGLSLKDYIGMAYSLEPPQVVAPEWTAQLRLDISANLPPDGTREQIPQMLQALLADRFALKVHKESRESPISHWESARAG